ncbi:MAG: cysteine desulfurase family protein, partial [Anaerovoracaceae bacterium]
QILGGGQEGGMRSGTENVPGIAGMAEASRLACGELEENLAHVTSLRDRLLEGILREIPEVRVNSPAGAAPCLPYILNVSFLGTRAEVLLHMLEQKEIYVSTGSACSSNSKKKGSHVLRAMGLKDEEIEGAVRFSFSYQNTPEEIDAVLKELKAAVTRNRKMLALANKSAKRR